METNPKCRLAEAVRDSRTFLCTDKHVGAEEVALDISAGNRNQFEENYQPLSDVLFCTVSDNN